MFKQSERRLRWVGQRQKRKKKFNLRAANGGGASALIIKMHTIAGVNDHWD